MTSNCLLFSEGSSLTIGGAARGGQYRSAPFDPDALRAEALEWATTRGSRSGRVAFQFTQELAGRLGQKLRD